jgi:hypothetical protein
MDLGGIVVPSMLRDSLGILDAISDVDGPVRPELVITDTGSYSDLVIGPFAIRGYQFSPRIADITDARLWRLDMARDYGPLGEVESPAHRRGPRAAAGRSPSPAASATRGRQTRPRRLVDAVAVAALDEAHQSGPPSQRP